MKNLKGIILLDFVDGMKVVIEFFLFMSDVIRRRNEIFECKYPFMKQPSNHCQGDENYPFIQRSKYNHEMTKLNAIRHELKRQPSPIKHTTTTTYFDLH